MSIDLVMFVGHQKELRANVTTELAKLQPLKPGMEVCVSISSKDKRSLTANALSHVWYSDIAKAWGESELYARCYCKLHFGVAILRAELPTFRELYDKAIKNALSYEEKLKAMKILPVTRLMNKEQMCRYLNVMQVELARADSPVVLQSPADSEYQKWQEAQVA